MSKPKITIEDLFDLKGSEIFNPDGFKPSSNVSTDTRKIRKNSIFVAIKGDRFDGHDFVKEALDKGASAIVINRNRLKNFDRVNIPIVTVKNTVEAYGEIANIWRHKLNAKVIGITGSNGKTGTKEILSVLLSEKYKVSKTAANNNNHIGVPLTILETGADAEMLVLEMGTNHFGEIAYTASVAEPDFALLTNIGESHLEFLHDLEGVANEKFALPETVSKRGGTVLINSDDPILKRKAAQIKPKVTFGFRGKCDVKGKITDIKDGRPKVEITCKGRSVSVQLPIYGISGAKNFIAAAAAALTLGLSMKEIKKGAAELQSVNKRLAVKNLGSFTLINDTYNANPVSMRSAFEFMASFRNRKRRIAVIGDMFELGKNGKAAHRELAADIKKNKINEVYTIGDLMKNLNKEIKNEKITARHFNDRQQLASFLAEIDYKDSVVLFKGSRGMKMEEFVNVIEKES